MSKLRPVVIVTIILLAAVAMGAQHRPSRLDGPTTLRLPAIVPSCGMQDVLIALARDSQVELGFEERKECVGHFPRVDVNTSDQTPMRVREVLDRLIALSSDYGWAEVDGVVVIRPAAAWRDANNALNTRVAPFRLVNTTVTDALHSVLKTAAVPRNPDAQHFDLAFNGGTMVDALNALVRSRGALGWIGMDDPDQLSRRLVIRTIPKDRDMACGEGAFTTAAHNRRCVTSW